MKLSGKGALLNCVLQTLCALIWWLAAGKHGGLMYLCAVLWTATAAIWWYRYIKVRKTIRNSEITGGNVHE